MTTNMQRKQSESGFALLISLIVVGVVLSVGLSLLDVSIKQVRLSSNAADSEIAFHAANAGLECARYIREDNSGAMEAGDSITPSCFNGTLYVSQLLDDTLGDESGDTNDDEIYKYDYKFTWGDNSDRCTEVTTVVVTTELTGDGSVFDAENVVSGYESFAGTRYMTCSAGQICTLVSTRGYNKSCSNINDYGTIQREVIVRF